MELISPVRMSLSSVLCHGSEIERNGLTDEFSDSDELLCNISYWNEANYVDSSLSGVVSEQPVISRLVYLSPYVDSQLSSVEHDVVVCQGDEDYEVFLRKNLDILHKEKGHATVNSGTEFSPLDKKTTPGSSSRKRPLFIYVKTCSSSSYGYVMSKEASAESCASVPVSGDVMYVKTGSNTSYGYGTSKQSCTESCVSVSADTICQFGFIASGGRWY